jgi:hypothetical protein
MTRLQALMLASPFLFMLHEAEEYHTMIPWLERNAASLPGPLQDFLPASPAVFAYAAVIFFVVFMISLVYAWTHNRLTDPASGRFRDRTTIHAQQLHQKVVTPLDGSSWFDPSDPRNRRDYKLRLAKA